MSSSRKSIYFLVFALFLGLVLPGIASADDLAAVARAHPQAGDGAVDLSIRDAVLQALEGNLDIEIERFNPAIKDAEVMTATGEFDPTVRLEYSYEDAESPQTSEEGLSSGAGTTETVTKDLSVGVGGKLTTGTEYDLSFDREQSQFTQRDTLTGDTVNPSEYNLDLSLTLSQPLLKDFGRGVNTADIRIARGEKGMSREDFHARVIEVIAEAQSAYWDLVAAGRNLAVSEQSLALAMDLLEENRVRLDVGTMAPLEVLQAETGVAQREEEVITARSFIEDAEDNLKRILNLPKDVAQWKLRINPTDVPNHVKREIDLLAELNRAFEERPDYKKSQMQIENDLINEQFARNQLLPTADVEAEGMYMAVDEEFDEAFDDIVDREARTWQLGLSAEYPLRNRTARGEHEKARLERRQSEKELENLRLSIIVEVNKAVRDIRTGQKRIEVTAKSVELAEESLKSERKKLEVGVSTSHDVLEFEEELADAQRRAILARLEYAKALINLARATGVLLEENDIVIDEHI